MVLLKKLMNIKSFNNIRQVILSTGNTKMNSLALKELALSVND
jgi:hypothetical protein